jgi:hypothetical protein
MYSATGEAFEKVKQGKNFTYTYQGQTRTTKGISQYDYFSKTGKRVKLLKFLSNIGTLFDIFDFGNAVTAELDLSSPIPLDIGVITPLLDLAGAIVQDQKAENDLWLEESMQIEVDMAKLEGLEATRTMITIWNRHHEYEWELLPIYNETADKLIAGEFQTLNDLLNYESDIIDDFSKNITLLYRTIENKNKETSVDVIETLFINK